MSHNISEIDRQEGLTQAWHGLTVIRPDLSLENNWLNEWDISPRYLYYTDSEGKATSTGFQILTATDDPSISIGRPFAESYHPITNKEFLQLMKDSTEGIEGMQLVSVGSVRRRGRVFASFQTGELEAYRAGGRVFNPFLNYGNGHDQSSVLWANTSNICTVCDNTFAMNLAKVEAEVVKDATRQRHTKNVVARLPELGLAIRQANQAQQNFAAAFEYLAETKISQNKAEKLLVGFVVDTDQSELDAKKISTRARNIVGRLMDLFKGGRGNKGQTLADLFSAATEYYTHENAGNGKNPQKQYQSSEFGAGMATKQRFFDIVRASNACEDMIAKGAKLLEQDKE